MSNIVTQLKLMQPGLEKGMQGMMQWTPFTKPPEEGQLILVRLRPDTSDVKITVFHSRLVRLRKA
jgi:hypothetical protein